MYALATAVIDLGFVAAQTNFSMKSACGMIRVVSLSVKEKPESSWASGVFLTTSWSLGGISTCKALKQLLTVSIKY